MPFDFFGLPAELRDIIYDEIGFVTQELVVPVAKRDPKHRFSVRWLAPFNQILEMPNPHMLLVSHQFKSEYEKQVLKAGEATLIFLETTNLPFFFPLPPAFGRICDHIPDVEVRLIVDLRYGCHHAVDICGLSDEMENKHSGLMSLFRKMSALRRLRIKLKSHYQFVDHPDFYRALDEVLKDPEILEKLDILELYQYPADLKVTEFSESQDILRSRTEYEEKQKIRTWRAGQGWDKCAVKSSSSE